MSEILQINHSSLRNADLKDTGVCEKLLECLKNKGCLHIDIKETYVSISVDSKFPNGAKNIEIYGDWRTPVIDGSCRSKGAQILSLFLFNFSRISIPYNKIKTMGRKGRSIADLVLRNVFYSILRGERVYFSRGNSEGDNKFDETFKIFRTHYIWIIKAFFKKESVNSINLNEKIIYATHLGIEIFKDGLLDAGVRELYEVTVLKSKGRDVGVVNPIEFMKFRNMILSQLT